MRHDAARLLTERERSGSSTPSKKYGAKLDPRADWEEKDFGPNFASSARHAVYGWNCKELSDFLSPLQRFLDKSCGRPWDDVYSEICKVADTRTMDGYHLRQHVRSWLKYRYTIDDNGILCPETKRSYTWRDRKANENEIDLIEANRLLTYEKKKGLWFRYDYFLVNPNELIFTWSGNVPNSIRACELPGWDPNKIDINKTQVRSCSKKEIKSILTNKKLKHYNKSYNARVYRKGEILA